GDFARAESLVAEFLNAGWPVTERIQFIDQLACASLREEQPRFLSQVEGWTRAALELAPGTLTLKGTLGGVLVEQGRCAEAEPLLRDCHDRSTALPDQGITAYYLGVIAQQAGRQKQARDLMRRDDAEIIRR